MTPIDRGVGLTASEVLLAKIADHTFLDLWSWPNVFGRPGKELCDLLVVFGDDVIIFSDKTIEWPSGPTEVAWPRWYRRAIEKSVDQIRGAARWLQNNPGELFVDAKCRQRLPLELPPIERRRVHGVCVALGSEEAAAAHFNDRDGTFFVLPDLRGGQHVDFSAKPHMPFAIGDVDPAGPFVHVFNQLSLEIVMGELDTVSDFATYLQARESLIRSQALLLSPSEAEILANYLQVFRDGKHAFPRPEDFGAPPGTRLTFVQGEYAHLVRSAEYQRRADANGPSYLWDRVIRQFTDNVLKGTSYRILGVDPDLRLAERALRLMAQEDRFGRRMLGIALKGAAESLEQQGKDRFGRVILPNGATADPRLAYVFMVLKASRFADHEKYRRVRAEMLQTYCLATLHDHPEMDTCVGVALTAISDEGSSEDLVAISQQEWTPEAVTQLAEARQHFEILIEPEKLVRSEMQMTEFPADPQLAGMSRQQRRARERALRKKKG